MNYLHRGWGRDRGAISKPLRYLPVMNVTMNLSREKQKLHSLGKHLVQVAANFKGTPFCGSKIHSYFYLIQQACQTGDLWAGYGPCRLRPVQLCKGRKHPDKSRYSPWCDRVWHPCPTGSFSFNSFSPQEI